MAEVAYDESLHKLDEFCALLTQTNNQLAADRATLENLEEAMVQFEQGLDQTLGALGEAVADFQRQLGEEESAAEEEIVRLAEAARRGTGEGLPAAHDELGAAEGLVAERLQGNQADLDESFSELAGSGFDALASNLDALTAAGATLGEGLDHDFEELSGVLQNSRQRFEPAQAEAGEEMEQASAAWTGEKVGLDAEAGQCIEGWASELPATLESETTEFGSEFGRVYDDFQSQAEAGGQELAGAVASLFQETADFTASEAGAHLEGALEQAMERALPELGLELGALLAALGACEGAVVTLDPILDDLEIAGRVMVNIDRLLNAME
jgi:hypothetical protein